MKEYIVRCEPNKITFDREIVRCGECRNRYTQQRCAGKHPNWFCAAGVKQVTGKLNNPDDSLLTEDSDGCKEQKSKLELEKFQLSQETSTNSNKNSKDNLSFSKKENDDIISRQAAINAVKKWFVEEYNSMPHEYDEEVKDNVFTDMKWVDISLEHNKEIRKVLKSLPPVEPPKKVIAQIKIDTDEIVERIKEEYEITEKPVCDDAISRADTVNALCRKCGLEHKCGGADCNENWCPDVKVVMNMPPVEPKPVCEDAISRQAAIEYIDNYAHLLTTGNHFEGMMNAVDLLKSLDLFPPVEPKRPEIIRCKNCRHNNNCEIQYAAQAGSGFFCGLAKRKGEK